MPSNNATIATIPINQIEKKARGDDIQYGYDVYKAVKQHLPRYTITPTGVGFCLLIKRQLIDNFGLFDTDYGLGYHEENDFCQRINQYGYSAVMSNHSFVFHLESRSFSAEKKKKLNEENEVRLLKKYPYYTSLVQRYAKQEIDPVDHFSDIIGNMSKKKKLLINLYHFPASYNGTTKTGHSLLRYLKLTKLDNNIEVTIFTQPEAAAFHNLASYGFRIVTPDNIREEVFHVGYCPGQIFHTENLIYMNRNCYRNIFGLLDIIALRCEYLRSDNYKLRTIFYDSIKIADRIISISNFSKKDAAQYFTDLGQTDMSKIQTVYMGFPGHTFDDVGADISSLPQKLLPIIKSKNYVLVFGNDYKHKAIDKVIEHALTDSGRHYILLGPHARESLPDNITILPSGALSDGVINELAKSARVILFPSQYEGFGFPILEAARYGKPLVYFASEVGSEVVEMSAMTNAFPFHIFSDLLLVIEKAWEMPRNIPNTGEDGVRELDDYNKEVFDIILNELNTPEHDFKALEERWAYMGRISDYYHHTFGAPKYRLKVRGIKYLQKTSPVLYMRLRGIYRKRKAILG